MTAPTHTFTAVVAKRGINFVVSVPVAGTVDGRPHKNTLCPAGGFKWVMMRRLSALQTLGEMM